MTWVLRRLPIGLLLLVPLLLSAQPADDFDRMFTGATLRFDYHHSGTAGEERIGLDQIRLEGPWPGRSSHLQDDSNLGKYLFQVIDPRTHLVVFSSGFSSIYGEWETTGEARDGNWRSFHESQRFPEPRFPVQLVLKKRAADGTFREIFSRRIDPASRFVNRSGVLFTGPVFAVVESGPSSEKVDLLVLGDGYTAGQMAEYRDDVSRVAEALFSFPPFSIRRSEFNVWGVETPAPEPGVTRPRADEWRKSPLGLSYNAFDSERYMLTMSNLEMRELAAQAPYDALILIANSDKYGGGGIFNLYSTAAAKSAQMPYLIVHEFGHAFAGLGDEYYTSQVAYEDFTAPGTEPWEPNVTALLDPQQLKWAELLTAEVPIPTPWSQDAYDELSLDFQKERAKLRQAGVSEERMDEYFAEVKGATTALLGEEPHAGEVGAFRGASYEATSLYRPSLDCIMFSRNPQTYCPVCSAAIERVIRLHTGR